MSDQINSDASLEDAFKSEGLDINNPKDMRLFQEVKRSMGAGCNHKEASKNPQDNKNRDGVSILQQFNDEHPLGEASPAPTPRQVDPKNMSGFDLLDQYYENHKL